MEYDCLMRVKEEISNLEANGLGTHNSAMELKEI